MIDTTPDVALNNWDALSGNKVKERPIVPNKTSCIKSGSVSSAGSKSNAASAVGMLESSTSSIKSGPVSSAGSKSNAASAVGMLESSTSSIKSGPVSSAGSKSNAASVAGMLESSFSSIKSGSVSSAGSKSNTASAVGMLESSSSSIKSGSVSSAGSESNSLVAIDMNDFMQIDAPNATTASKYESLVVAMISNSKEASPMSEKDLKSKLMGRKLISKKPTRSQQRRKVLIDSCAERSIISDIDLLDMSLATSLRPGSHYVSGVVAGSRSMLSARAPIISPFEELTAFYHDTGADNIISLDELEQVYDVHFAGSMQYNNRRMVCKHRVNKTTLSCWKDPTEKNFYVYDWKTAHEFHDSHDRSIFLDYSAGASCTNTTSYKLSTSNSDEVYSILKTDSDLITAQKLGLSRVRALRAIEVEALHKALSHASAPVLKQIVKEKIIDGISLDPIDVDNWKDFLGCNACVIGKTVREDHVIDPIAPLPITSRIGEIVHTDCFNIGTSRPDGKPLHLVLTIDDYSGMTHTRVVNKADATTIANTLKIVASEYTEKGHKLSTLKRDSGGSMPNVDALLVSHGIICSPSSVGRHVRVAERAIRHIKELFRTLLFDLPYLLPVDLFPSAIKFITQSMNLTPNVNNKYRAPLHLFDGEFPRHHDHLRSSFGALVATYNLTDPNDRKDDFPRADIGIVVGRDPQRPGNFLIQDLRSKVIKPRHDVTPVGWNNTLLRRVYELYGKEKGTAEKIYFVYGDITQEEPIDLSDKRNIFERDIRLPDYDDEGDPETIAANVASINSNCLLDDLDQDFEIKALNTSVGKARKAYGDEITFQAAIKELKAMYKHEVWQYVPKNENVDYAETISSQMFLKEKTDASNKFEELKARIIGHGHLQDIDSSKGGTSSPTIAMTTVLAGISIAAKDKSVELAVFDVKNAYLNAFLKDPEGQLMFLPKDVVSIMIHDNPDLQEFVRSDGRILVRLRKALYGLKTAGRDWFEEVKGKLISFGYTQSVIDPCLFLGEDIQIYVYVDDFLTIGKSTAIDTFRDNLTLAYGKLKEKRGNQISYLGMNITRKENGDIVVDQRGYVEKILNEYEVTGHASLYPATSNLMHSDCHDSSTVEEDDYLSLVMKLMFVATRTRPDILFPTVVLATRSKTHLKIDYDRLIKILKYLNGARDKGLKYKHEGKIKLRMFVDAGFQTHKDAKGQTGFVIFPDSSSAGVLFKCKKQTSVSQSSAEAELISLFDAVTYLKWVASIYEELGYGCKPIPVYEDNKSTIMMSIDPQIAFKGRSKFIDRKFFGVYEHVENGNIELLYVGTEEQIADFFTKVIIGNKFKGLRYSIMGCDSYDD